jgi:transposase
MLFPPSVLGRAMQIKEVILRTINGEYTWNQAAEILGITSRGLRRLRQRMDQFGYQGLVDRRRGRPSPRRTAVAEIERILALYRERYSGFNARHFCSTVRREHGVKLSYTCLKQLLQGAGLVKKRRSRGRHRMRRERKPRFGQMLHLDGSTHAWLALRPEERQTLIQVVDDATSRLLYAQLWPSETSLAVMTAMSELVREHGIPESYYTDRASWAFETPKAGGKVSKTHLTQVGDALARLGVEHIPSYSPQARGRSERMNRTLQDRLVNELKAAGITSVESANCYLLERYLPTHNAEFAIPPADPESAFVELGAASLEDIFFEEQTRTVAKDNTVSWEGVVLQIRKQPGRPSCAGLQVAVRRYLDGSYRIYRGRTQCLGAYDTTGRSAESAATPSQAAIAARGRSEGPSSARGRSAARVPASSRLRLPPAGTLTKPANA